ncbi:MAG: hypothetical protein ACREFY_13610, partial [Acetobacteraceae bacterium]
MTSAASAPVQRVAVGGRTMWQGLFGVIAVILGIVGLAIAATHPSVPIYLAAIAEIAMGLSLIASGAGLSAAYARLLARSEGTVDAVGNAVGTTVDAFVGGGIVILAILAILGVAPVALISISVILVGVGLLLYSAASVRLANLESSVSGVQEISQRVGEEMVLATASVRAVAGVAVLVLG